MRRVKKYLIGVGIFFVLFTVFGFFGLPAILKSILIKQLSQNLRREVTIREVKVNPYTLSLTVRDLKVKDRASSEAFVSFDELYLNLQIMSAIRRAVIFKEIRLKKPFMNLVRHQDLSYNFSDLMDRKESKPEPKPESKPEEKAKPLRFSLNNISIENGSVDFSDEPMQKKHTVRDMTIGIPFISNFPTYMNTFVKPAFSVNINDTAYGLEGQTKPFADSRETTFDINISDFNIPYYLAYAPMKMNFKIPSAFLDTKAKISFVEYKDRTPSLTVSGDVALRKIAVDDEKNAPLLRLPQVDIAIAPSEPILKKIHLAKVSVQSPELEISRDRKGTINIETLFPKAREAVKAPKEPAKPAKKEETPVPLSIDIDEVQLMGGKVTFSDLSRSKPFKTVLNPVELKIDHFSNGKEKKTNYLLSVKTEANETVKLDGELSVDPMKVNGGIEVKSVLLKKYSPYYMDNTLFDIEDGRLDFSTRYKYEKGEKEPLISLSEMSAALGSLRLKKRDEKEDFASIPVLSVRSTGLDMTGKEVSVGDISAQKGSLLVRRYRDGKLNLTTLFPEPPHPQEKPGQGGEKTAEKPPEKPWLVKGGKVSLDQYTVKVEDLTNSEPVNIVADEINLKAENLSTAKGQKGNASLALRLNQKGTISVNGPVGINPLYGDLRMGLKGIDIPSLQAYFTDRVKIIVQDGSFSTTGTLSLNDPEGKGIQIAYKGESSLTHFKSVDKLNAEDFLKWESLSFENMDVGYNPLYVHIDGIALTNFYSRIIVFPEGSLNLQNILEKGNEKAQKPSGPKDAQAERKDQTKEPTAAREEPAPKDIRIGQITLQGGEINYTDNFIKPNYSANLTELGGRVSGLASEETKTAEVEVRGKLNNFAPLEITGKINPLSKDLLVDLNIRFRDIDLSPVTPYSGRYVGYTIQKGKLSLDLKYLILKRKLESQNKIYFDQLTLGDKVDSPTATKLPVKLGIALLKDRKGEIDLNIPVSGSLDDPQFSVFSIVLKVITNLLVKAATSPFSLLGSIFEGGEQLEFMEFDYGSSEIKGENEKKLGTLIKILQDRPGVKLEIEGHVDMEKDKEGLTQIFFNRKLKAQKLKELIKKGLPSASVDEVKIDPPEYARYLKMAYKEETFPKPKNFLGFEKDIPGPEMEKLMFTHIEVNENNLRTLAAERSQKVKESVLRAGQIQSERIFIVEPKSLTAEKKEKLKDSRVNFKLG